MELLIHWLLFRGGIASGAKPLSILAIGISILIGDGLAMGWGDFYHQNPQIILSKHKGKDKNGNFNMKKKFNYRK